MLNITVMPKSFITKSYVIFSAVGFSPSRSYLNMQGCVLDSWIVILQLSTLANLGFMAFAWLVHASWPKFLA